VRRFYGLTLSGFGFLVILAAALGQGSVASTDKPTAIGREIWSLDNERSFRVKQSAPKGSSVSTQP
jgi:hypothetical protein